MIKSLKLYFLLAFGFLAIVAPITLLNYFQDPYAIFKKIVDEDTYISKEYRFSFPNIAKKMEFDTAIIGTSDSLPYHQLEVKKEIKGIPFNFAIEGATNYEQSLLVKSILDEKPNTLVIWQINWLSFLWVRDHSRIGNNFPLYLYEKSNFESYLKSLLNPFTAIKGLSFLNNFHSLIKIANLKSWDDSTEDQDFSESFEDRKNNFFEFVNNNNNIRKFDRNELDFQFDLYVESTINEFKDASFIIVLPPFHSRFLDEIKNENPLLFEQFSHFNHRASALAKKYNNVNLVNFHEKCNFKNRDEIYKDLFHFKNRYAIYFIKEILNINNTKVASIDCPQ